MYIESIPNRSSPPAILLRESFREGGRVGKRTLANLSALAIALIASRLVSPASKLATARELAAATAASSLGRLLRLGEVDEVELYRALDWLGARQSAIETGLAHRHLTAGALVLYDVSSSWLEGRCCQLSLFDERDLAEITAPEFPGERLVVCKNPLLAEERARKREDLLQATEAALGKLADQIARGNGRKGQDKIARAVGRIENRYKLAKLFDIAVAEDGFSFARNPARIAAEARLDGFYVIRTSVEDKTLAADRVVGAYKDLAHVERAFRSLKTVDLHLRPIHHWLAPRVRAHVFLCMLACHVEWHMRERLKPMLFDDEDPTAAARERASIVAPAQPSPTALRKRASKITANGSPVHSFQSLLRDLATCTLNEMITALNDAYSFTLVATPTPIQAQAFSLLAVDPTKL